MRRRKRGNSFALLLRSDLGSKCRHADFFGVYQDQSAKIGPIESIPKCLCYTHPRVSEHMRLLKLIIPIGLAGALLAQEPTFTFTPAHHGKVLKRHFRPRGAISFMDQYDGSL